MATTATTPNPPGRHTSLLIGNNQRKHSVRTGNRSLDPQADRPNAPVFLEEPLFLQGLSHGTAVAGGSRSTATGSRASLQQLGMDVLRDEVQGGSTNKSKKRTAGEVLDLTTTTTNSPEQDNPIVGPSGRQVKKPRMPWDEIAEKKAELLANRQKQQKKREREQRQEKLAQESAMWRAKYKKAFPSFTFYFDTIDEATKAQLGIQVKKLGASVDQFFSKKVTHVVTSRSLPTQSNKENIDSPALSTSKSGGQVESAVGKTKKHSVRSPKSYSLLNGQKLRPHAGDLEKNPFIDSQDILSKAMDFKLKIWHLEKLHLILARINSHSPNKDTSLQRNPSLPSLLRDEQLYGTRERDPFVPRHDMHYFAPNKYYLLVEDSTGEHRPIVIQEYDKPRKHEDPTWPVLYGGIEGRSGFYKPEGPPVVYQARYNPNPVPKRPSLAPSAKTIDGSTTTKLMAGFSTTAARAVGAPNLRRAISLQNVPGAGTSKSIAEESKHAAPGGIHRRDSYIAASGNSQIITSNTGTSTRSGAAMQPGTGKGGAVDKRLALLQNRAVSMSMGGASGSGTKKEVASNKVKPIRRSKSTGGGDRWDLGMKMREEPKKPGYCENCRIKYDDFKTHVVSNKHRRFALNDKNWIDLDGLLEQIARRTVRVESILSPSQSSVASSSPARNMEDSGFFDQDQFEDKDSEDHQSEEDDGEGGSDGAEAERMYEDEDEAEDEEDEEL